MHEFSVMTQIVQSILKEIEKNKLMSVEEVHLDIGTLTFLGETQVKFAYQVLTNDNILKNSKLLIKIKKPIVECKSCGYSGDIQYETFGVKHSMNLSIPKFSCPKCKRQVKVIQGQECTITRIIGNVEEKNSV